MDVRYKILEAREQRIKYIYEVIDKYNKFVVVIKSNICGNNKNPYYTKFLKTFFYTKVCNRFDIFNSELVASDDGDYYLLVINDCDLKRVKDDLIALENSKLGRLIDLDLYCDKSKSVSRSDFGLSPRKCIICGSDTAICSRCQAHQVDEVIKQFETIFKEELVKIVIDVAYQAIIDEVSAHPKFGLVTNCSNGKHEDMDYQLFIKSATAIKPFLEEYAKVGFKIDESSFATLRAIGKQAEQAMFTATNGVNTHKGVIFLLGFLLPAITRKVFYGDDLQNTIKFLAKDIYNDFEEIDKPTFGINAYHQYQITGIRGQVSEGMELTFNIYEKYCDYDIDNATVLKILLSSMSKLDDTVILHRKDISYLEHTKTIAKQILVLDEQEQQLEIERYTKQFIDDGVSPGGSADITITVLILIYMYKCGGVKW